MGKLFSRKNASHVSAVGGFACYWIWIWCVFWSSLFFEERSFVWLLGEPSGFETSTNILGTIMIEPLWVVSLAANVLAIGLLLVLSRRKPVLGNQKVLIMLAALLTSLGTAAISRWIMVLVPELQLPVYYVGAILTGLGSGVIYVLWAEIVAHLGVRVTINFCISALLFAVGGYLIIQVLPLMTAQAVVTIIPVLSMLSFVRFRRESLQNMPELRRVQTSKPKMKSDTPKHMIAVALFFGVSFGLAKGLIAPAEDSLIALRDILNIVGIILGTLTVYVTVVKRNLDYDRLTHQIALPLMAAGFLFIPLSEPWNVIGAGVHQFGYQYFYIVLWSLWAVIVAQTQAPAGWIVCWGLFAIQAGQLGGSLAGSLLLTFFHTQFQEAMIVAMLIFIFLLVAIFAVGNGTVSTAWGFVKPMESEGPAHNLDLAIAVIARDKRLSPREREVFALLARGRNRAYIREELVIGDETVKSHIKNVYRKCELHSQQELIDMVEAEAENEATKGQGR